MTRQPIPPSFHAKSPVFPQLHDNLESHPAPPTPLIDSRSGGSYAPRVRLTSKSARELHSSCTSGSSSMSSSGEDAGGVGEGSGMPPFGLFMAQRRA